MKSYPLERKFLITEVAIALLLCYQNASTHSVDYFGHLGLASYALSKRQQSYLGLDKDPRTLQNLYKL